MKKITKASKVPFWRNPEYIFSAVLAANVLVALNLDDMIAETEYAAERIHLRGIYNENLIPRMSTANTAGGYTYALAFERITKNRRAMPATYAEEDDICFARTHGYRIPFTNAAYAATMVGCGHDEAAAADTFYKSEISYKLTW